MNSDEDFSYSSNFSPVRITSYPDFPLQESLQRKLEEINSKLSPAFQLGLLPILLHESLYLSSPSGTQRSTLSIIGLLTHIDSSLNKVQGLVIIPRKNLIDEYLDTFSKYDPESHFKLTKLIGGESFNKKELAKSHILICSPGKLVGLIGSKTIDLSHVKIVVLDVCNGLFYKDIKGQTDRILRALDKSLTFWYLSPIADEVSKESFLDMKPDGKTIDICDTRALHQIKYFKFYYENEDNIFDHIRSRCLDYDGQIVIFGCDLEELDRIKDFLLEFRPLVINDGLDLSQQLSIRDEFKENRSKVMICHGSFHLARKIITKSTVEIFNLDMQEGSILLARARRGAFCEGDKVICFFREFEEEEIEKLEKESQVKFETLILKS